MVVEVGEPQPKPRRKHQSKKLAEENNELPEQDNSHLRLVKNWVKISNSRQNQEFNVPVNKQFKKNYYPKGELLEYPKNFGFTDESLEERNAREVANEVDYDALRQAGEVHKQVRRYIQKFLVPGVSTLDIVQKLEAKSAQLISVDGINRGWAFPTGISMDNVAAHYTPNYGEEIPLLTEKSIAKIDYGVHVGGRIVDCAFSVAFDPMFDNLIQATIDATNHGLKRCGIDALIGEIGGEIQEIIQSYEMIIDDKIYPIKPVENLSGHSIERYRIHAGKSVPLVKVSDSNRMVEGEVYAIETFASTGKGYVTESGNCSHYMLDYEWENNLVTRNPPRLQAARTLLQTIRQNFKTLAFCRRWLDDIGEKKHHLGLRALEMAEIVRAYPPLADIKGSYTSQTEHTIILKPTGKEIVTRGDDY